MLSDIARYERDLLPLWDEAGHHPERIDFYTKLVIDHPVNWGGRDVVAEFVAAMMLEAGLDNLILGNNPKNGSDNPYIGIGWCQLDTGYHATTLDFVHELRQNPVASLDYIIRTPDLAYVGTERVWCNTVRWHSWQAPKIDPTDGSWSPLEACLKAYDRVTGAI